MKKQRFDINELLDRIIKVSGKDQKEIAEDLGYREAYLSAARKEPTEKIYNKLLSYEKELGISKEYEPKSKEGNFRNDIDKDSELIILQKKHIELQEKHIALLEKQAEQITPIEVHQIHQLLSGIAEQQHQRTKDIEMIRREILSNRAATEEIQKDARAYLHTLYRWSIPHFAKFDGVPVEQVRSDMDTYLASQLHVGE